MHTSGIDNEHVRSLAREAMLNGLTNAPEIGRRVATAIGSEFENGEPTAWANLIGLAALGASYYGRSVLKENKLRVKRRGSVTTISGGYALPSSVVSNGRTATASVDLDEPPAQSEYRQFDLLTWAEFSIILDELRGRRAALDATVITFEEVAKLEAMYPEYTVGEAIEAAGLDLSGRSIDLDSLDLAI